MFPSIDDETLVLGSYAEQDITLALSQITRAIQGIRKTTGWVSSDLGPYKAYRRILHGFLEKARMHSLTEAEHYELQSTLGSCASLLQN